MKQAIMLYSTYRYANIINAMLIDKFTEQFEYMISGNNGLILPEKYLKMEIPSKNLISNIKNEGGIITE